MEGEQQKKYSVPDAIVEVKGRRFRMDSVTHFKTCASRAVHTLVVYEDMLALTLGLKKDAKVLTALYLGIGVSCVYKQLRLLETWKERGLVEEIGKTETV